MSKEATWDDLFVPETPKANVKDTYQRDFSYGMKRVKCAKKPKASTRQIIQDYLEGDDF